MEKITIRNISKETLDGLRILALNSQRSLDAEVRHILESAVENQVQMAAKRTKFLEASLKFLKETEGCTFTPSELLIRHDRDHGHREL